MNKRNILIIIGLVLLAVVYQFENSTCTERYIPSYMLSCKNLDGTLKGFRTSESMNAYYVVKDTITVDGAATETLNVIGKETISYSGS